MPFIARDFNVALHRAALAFARAAMLPPLPSRAPRC
jgi:hypothetical protein